MDGAKLQRAIELRRRRDELELLLAEVKKEENQLSQLLVEEFIADGVQNVKALGGTLYLAPTLRASLTAPEPAPGEAQQDPLAAFRAAGYGYLCKEIINANSLAAWVRELRKNGDDVPEDLVPFVTVHEEMNVRVRLDGSAQNGDL